MVYRGLAALLLLAACRPVVHEPAPNPAPAFSGRTKDCPIIGSSDWTGWINAMPGPGLRPTLIVSGKVTVPTGGYRLALRLDPAVMQSYPPQLTVWLDAVPSEGPATQALVTSEVRGQWPATPPIGAIHIRCGGTAVGHIAKVVTAH